MNPLAPKHAGSVTLTRGVRIAVAPSYLPEHSDPGMGRYVFGYRIRITNESGREIKLLSRHWTIVDGEGNRHEVDGEGVVGQQPELSPGEVFTYSSFCPLGTPRGTMEGRYTMQAADGERFEVEIGRFYLVTPEREPSPGS